MAGFSSGAYDQDMQTALEESARAFTDSVSNILIGTQSMVRRETLSRADKHAPGVPKEGKLYQIGTLNQFHAKFASLATEYGAPSAVCGYVVCAEALLLEEYLLDVSGVMTSSHIQSMCDMLTDFYKMEPVLRRSFEGIQGSRDAFCAANPVIKDGTNEAQVRTVKKQWVANYEVGDFLANHSISQNTHFLRLNQWPERADATPDEGPRLLEEARFGGRRLGGEGSTMVYGEHDSVYFIQSFVPHSVFRSPDEWVLHRVQNYSAGAGAGSGSSAAAAAASAAAAAAATISGTGSGASSCTATSDGSSPPASPPPAPQVFVLDLNGHFAVAVSCYLDLAGDGSSSSGGSISGERSLLLFQTTPTDYLHTNPALAYAFDSAFVVH